MATASIEFRGAAALRRRLGDASRVRGAQRAIVRTGTRAAASRARTQAPGSLGSAVQSRVEDRPREVVGIVRLRPKTNRGFRYPQALNYSRTRRYRHRRGPRKGKPTRGWFTSAKTGVRAKMRQEGRRQTTGLLGWLKGAR